MSLLWIPHIHYIRLCLSKVKLPRLCLAGFEEVNHHVVRRSILMTLRNNRQLLGTASQHEKSGIESYNCKEMNSANNLRKLRRLFTSWYYSETVARNWTVAFWDPKERTQVHYAWTSTLLNQRVKLVLHVNYFLDHWVYFKSFNESFLSKILLKCSKIHFFLK